MAFTEPLTAVKDALKQAKIIPDILPESFTPNTIFTVSYPKGGDVKTGQEFDVNDAQEAPSLRLLSTNAGGGGSYMIALVDPDARPAEGKTLTFFRHWLITGLKQSHGSASKGQTPLSQTKKSTAAYKGPAPRPGTGLHRYTFLLFQEPSSGIEIPEGSAECEEETELRRSFDVLKFAEQYGLKLIGADFMLVQNAEDK